MNCLVIGGAGYLGSKVVQHLYKDAHNHGEGIIGIVDNLMYDQGPLVFPHWPNHQSFWHCDVDEIPDKVLASFDVIFLFSALVGAPICDKYPEEAWRVNTESVRRLVKRLSPKQRLIFPCTNSGYGIQTEICDENTPMNSISIYGKSKEEAEKIVMEHPNATSFRLATLYGVSWRHRVDLMVNYFTYLAVCKGHIDLFEGDFLRNFVHVEDVARILVGSIDRYSMFGQVYNLGRDAENTTKYKLAEQVVNHPDVGDVKLTYTDKEDPDKRNYNVSSLKLMYYTGFKAEIPLSDGIAELVQYYKKMPKFGTKEHDEFLKTIKNA